MHKNRLNGPLGNIQKKGDDLKIKIDEIAQITMKWSPKNADDEKVKEYHKNCVAYMLRVSSLLLNAHQLKKHEEPNLINHFDEKKNEEINRLLGFKNRLNKIIDDIEELEGGEQLRNTRTLELKDKDAAEDSEQEEEEEDFESELDEEEGEGEEEDLYEALADFKAEQKEDLSIQAGEIVDVISKRKDGWWKVENEHGARGIVPSTFLKEYSEEEEEEVRDEEESAPPDSRDEVIKDDRKSTEGALNKLRSGKELWKGVKDQVTEPHTVDVTDVLAAMGALPAGFRPSMLHSLLTQSSKYSLHSTILPTMSESNLAFDDLKLDPATGQLHKMVTRVLRSCRIWKCRMIPSPAEGVEVLSRHVRVALFDGTKVLSNVQTIRAKPVTTNTSKIWTFLHGAASTKKHADKELNKLALEAPNIPQSVMDGNLIVRSQSNHSNIGILFELALTYIRTPPKRLVQFSDGLSCEYSDDEDSRQKLRDTGERGELSCGWVHLKLFDEMGNPIPNKTYELSVNGGTPFEQGVDVDPSIARRANTNRFRSLLAANKQPKLMVQIGAPAAFKKKYLDLLPLSIVTPSSYAELIAYYRRILVEKLVQDKARACDADLVHSPVINSFVEAIQQADLMDALRQIWDEKNKFLNTADKRDKENMKTIFRSCVMESVYPLLSMSTLPEPKWADRTTESKRRTIISQTLNQTKQPNGVLTHLLSSTHEVKPFSINEVTFDLIQNHSRILA